MKILYVDIDTLRPDHLGCYGYARNTSPNIDAVAADGVRFNDYYCSDAPCLPSRAALMTGRFGIHTGCIGHGGLNAEMCQEGRDRGMADFNGRYNLPAMLRRTGMRTASVSSFPDRHGAWWFNGGFDETINIGKRGLEGAEEVLPYALDWLKRNEQRKDWFLHVHIWDPHLPYRVPLEYGEPFADVPLPDPWMTQELLDWQRANKPGTHSPWEVTGYDDEPNPLTPRQPVKIENLDDFRKMIDGYDTGIWYADKHVGMLMDELKRQGIYEETAVIISSDHGEDLGELASYCEHGEADAIVTHIPLIVKWPGCTPGAVSNGLHYNVDLLPTLMDMVKDQMKPLPYHRVVGKLNPVKYDGESFADSLLTGADGGREFLVVSQNAHVCQRGVRFGDYIYIRTYHDGYHLTDEEELFNIKEDPHEQHDLAHEMPELCWKGAWYLEHWVADNMRSNIKNSNADPMWNVMHEGGPFHCRGYLKTYCERLEKTGRGDLAKKLREKYPDELEESY